jgi:transposase
MAKALKEIINDAVLDALERNKWNRTHAARELKCSIRTVYAHIKKLEARGVIAQYSSAEDASNVAKAAHRKRIERRVFSSRYCIRCGVKLPHAWGMLYCTPCDKSERLG